MQTKLKRKRNQPPSCRQEQTCTFKSRMYNYSDISRLRDDPRLWSDHGIDSHYYSYINVNV